MTDAAQSLADVARSSFETRFCRTVAAREQGDVAYVLFDTGPESRPYLYGINYERRDGHWSEGTSSNGPGWAKVGPMEGVGTLTLWGEAPPGADKVRVEFEEKLREELVSDGVFLAVWWSVSPPERSWPRAAAFRINGEWLANVAA